MTSEQLAVAESAIALAKIVLYSIREEGGWVTINGSPVFIGDDDGSSAAGGRSAKAEIAAKHQVKADKSVQDIAEKSELKLAAALGLPKSSDNKPFDLFDPKTKVGVEIKTMVTGKNGKITMSKAALARKSAFIEEHGVKKTFTVVADMRDGRTTARYYVSDRLGSLRIGSMTPTTLPALKALLKGG